MGTAPRWNEAGLWELFDLSRVSGSDLQGYLEVTLARCVAWFQASSGSIFLGEPGRELELQASVGAFNHLPERTTIRPGQGIGGIVAQSGQARIIDDPRLDPDLRGVAGNQTITSSMVIPLLDGRRQTLGVLNISRQKGEAKFRERDLEQAVALAGHVSLAVMNAQMVGQLHAQVSATQAANEKMVAVLDSVSGAVVVIGPDGEIENHNRAAETAQFLLAPGLANLQPLQRALAQVSEAAVHQHSQTSQRAFDPATDRTWLVEGVPLASGGAVVTVQEITEHERQIRELSRVKRLAEIGQMTAAIAHEIRNPLTGIRSAAQMIRQHPETSGEFIGMIEEEALKLNDLCDDFLEFARPLQLNRDDHDLAEVVGRVCELMRPTYQESGVGLLVEFTTDGRRVRVDERRMGQVAHNLLRNALQASTPGQTVFVRVRPGDFEVEDQGTGIDPADLPRLFSPFFTTKADGTGLGLCNARKIIDAHGGEIAVDSTPGRGTKFSIVIDRNVA